MVNHITGRPRWGQVTGPGVAIVLTLHELAWKWISLFAWFTGQGLQIDARVVCPDSVVCLDIKEMAKRDHCSQQEDSDVKNGENLDPAPLVRPVQI